MFEKIRNIHFVGIGGSGMCGIAEVLLNMGYSVSGSDISANENVGHLRSLGALIHIGHDSSKLDDPHVVVVSSAISRDNTEVAAAVEKNIPVIPRAEMLTELMRLKYALCVAGTHGKTTTTSMVGLILYGAGMDPTLVVGGKFNNLESNAKLGRGEFMVAEADESDGSFLHLTPAVSIVTNIDDDHMDYYGSMDKLRKTFTEFLNKVPFYGFSVLCGDDLNIKKILSDLDRPYKTYGLSPENDFYADNVELSPEKTTFTVYSGGRNIGDLTLGSTGMHNVLNALASCVTAMEIGIDFPVIRKSLGQYRGVGRRLEKKGEAGDIIFYDDYAHHPSEINLSLKSLKKIYPDRRLVAVFQPHRYTRTRDLRAKFPDSLNVADRVFITEIYSAGETPISGVSGKSISEAFEDPSKIRYCPDLEELTETVSDDLRPGDVCVTLGAGDICSINAKLLRALDG